MSKSRDIADSAATINYIDTVTSNVQTQLNTLDTALDNISVTSGTLTKTFTNGETASISLTSNVLVPNVSVTKEVPQSGATNNTWDVNSTTENYTRLNSAPATTLDWVTGNVSTATALANQSFGNGSSPVAVVFNLNGTKMYATDYTDKAIYSYTLSTPWDVTTKSSLVNSFNLANQIGNPHGMCFNSDGTIIFTCSYTGQVVNKYTLTTAFDISSASFSQSLDVSASGQGPTGVQVNTTGTKLYVSNDSTGDLKEWDLTTAYDLSTASYNNVNISISSPRSMAFADNGTKLYIVSGSANTVRQYSLSSGFSLSNPTFVTSYDASGDDTNLRGIALKSDFSQMFLAGAQNDKVYSYNFSKNLALGTGSFASADVGKTIEANSGAFVLTATDGSYVETTAPTSYAQVASGSWGMFGVVYNTTDGDLELSSYIGGYYDIANSAYSNNSLTVSYGNTTGTFISSDGTKLYILGESNEIVLQYALSTPFDPSSGTFVYGLNIALQGSVWRDLTFNNDGTKMYLCSEAQIFTFALATPWVISSTANPVNRAFPTSTSIQGFCFNSDGSKLYTVSSGNRRVYENNLSAPFNPQFSIIETTSFSVASQTTNPRGIRFNSDGTKMFIMGKSGITGVIQYDLSSAFVVSAASASYNGVSFNVQSQENDPEGFVFNTDGSKMYVIGEDSTVYEYGTLSFGFPTGYQPVHTTASTDTTYWTDINSMTADQAAGDGNVYYAISTDDRTTWTVIDNTDGERDIVRNNAGTWQYNSNTTYASETWVNGATNTELATIAESMGSDGVGDIGNATYTSVNYSTGSYQQRGVFFSADGTKMFLGRGSTNDQIVRYTLSTAWDITTASLDSGQTLSHGSQDNDATSFTLSADGTRVYVVGYTSKSVYQYIMTTAYDLTTASYNSVSLSVNSQDSAPFGITFNNDGTKLYVGGQTNDRIFAYTLTTGFDLSTASYSSVSLSVSAQDGAIKGMLFNNAGTKLFMVGTLTDRCYQYSLTTAFDISTASYDSSSFSFLAQDNSLQGIAFKSDDTELFMIGDVSDKVYKYSMISFTAITANQMDKTQLDAVTDPNHIALGNDFDLSIILNMTSGTTVPSSNGVAINYDANILNKGAVLGTDYDFDAPAQNKVRITALAGNNLKVRVV
ncbi:hypothetical protein N9D25_01070 [Alphaproteobacteria bacterium]|nr:hypothetical protein [Alphaproteobacteria bacterium]